MKNQGEICRTAALGEHSDGDAPLSQPLKTQSVQQLCLSVTALGLYSDSAIAERRHAGSQGIEKK